MTKLPCNRFYVCCFLSSLVASTCNGEINKAALRATMNSQTPRFLGEGVITLVSSGHGIQTIKVSQKVLGKPGDCESDSADIFFATFLGPTDLQPTCGVFQRNANACFEQTVDVACDPQTNTATIDVYVRDRDFPVSETTENPKIGRCKAGPHELIRRAYKYSETFDCTSGPGGVVGAGTCTENSNECLPGHYCSLSKALGYHCKEYASIGSNCGGEVLDGAESQCNPDESYCLVTADCLIADTFGTCTAYSGNCSADTAACGADEYCDQSAGMCKAKLDKGNCCDQQNDACKDGLYCNFTEDNGAQCKAYVGIGDYCGGFTMMGYDNKCDPNEAYCFFDNYCEIADGPGKCTAYMGACSSSGDCNADEYCDTSVNVLRCKTRLTEGTCCEVGQDQCQEGLECSEAIYNPDEPFIYDFGTKCRSLA